MARNLARLEERMSSAKNLRRLCQGLAESMTQKTHNTCLTADFTISDRGAEE